MLIEYSASVFTPAGWRSVPIRARCAPKTAKMVTITEVLTIAGDVPTYGMSVTGAKRQSFNGIGVAAREIGAVKRLSACKVIEE